MTKRMLVFDTEVFPENFIFIAKIYGENDYVQVFNSSTMKEFYRQYHDWLWIGYNCLRYDLPIIQVALRDENPYETSRRFHGLVVLRDSDAFIASLRVLIFACCSSLL